MATDRTSDETGPPKSGENDTPGAAGSDPGQLDHEGASRRVRELSRSLRGNVKALRSLVDKRSDEPK